MSRIKNELDLSLTTTFENMNDYARIYMSSYRKLLDKERMENMKAKQYFSNLFPIISSYNQRKMLETGVTYSKRNKEKPNFKTLNLKKLDFIKYLEYTNDEQLKYIRLLIKYIHKNGIYFINIFETNDAQTLNLEDKKLSFYDFIFEMRYIKYRYLFINRINSNISRLTISKLRNSNLNGNTQYGEDLNYYTFTNNYNFGDTDDYITDKSVNNSPVLIDNDENSKTKEISFGKEYCIATLKTHYPNINLIYLFDSLYFDDDKNIYFIRHPFLKYPYEKVKILLVNIFDKLFENKYINVKITLSEYDQDENPQHVQETENYEDDENEEDNL